VPGTLTTTPAARLDRCALIRLRNRQVRARMTASFVLKSVDRCSSWERAGLYLETVHDLEPHPTDPMSLYAGTGEGVFRTAALLGSALFFGVREAGDLVAGPAPIIAYNGVHILVSMVIGLGAAWLIFQTEKNRPLWFLVFFVFLAGFIYSVAVVGVLAAEVVQLLSWPVITVANLAAGVTAGGYLWRRHASLLTELVEDGEGVQAGG